jgi:hypothetical protein
MKILIIYLILSMGAMAQQPLDSAAEVIASQIVEANLNVTILRPDTGKAISKTNFPMLINDTLQSTTGIKIYLGLTVIQNDGKLLKVTQRIYQCAKVK